VPDDGRGVRRRHPPALKLHDASLGRARVTLKNGDELELGAIAPEQPLLVVFLRHFACPGCSHFMTELSPRLPELRALGVAIVLVGSGSAARLGAFADRMKLGGPGVTLATDPSLEAFRAAGMQKSFGGTYGPKAVLGSIALYTVGHWVSRDPDDGDVVQQGGAVLLDAQGEVVLAHRDRDLMDHVVVSDVVARVLAMKMVEGRTA
jgi:peroxiredoxin